MKAAVIYQKGELPQYAEVPEPVAKSEDELLISVKAVAIKHFDKGRAKGTHYSSEKAKGEGKIIGGDGVGVLADGTRVYGIGASGMLAEKALIDRDRMVIVPEGLDDAVAAALPNAVIGAAMGLRFKAGIQPGDTVLINGATGFTGRVAVQLAKHYGAKKIIATGRNEQSLNELQSLGADEIIPVNQTSEALTAKLKELHAKTPIGIVIDYLWGTTAESILAALKGDGSFTQKTRYVSVGSVSGDTIQLSAASLRSADIQLAGSGLGSWSKGEVQQLFAEILPEAFQLANEGQLKVETVSGKLSEIDQLWETDVPAGKRLVVTV